MRASANPRRSAGVGAGGWATWSVGSALKEASAFKEASDDDMTFASGLRPGRLSFVHWRPRGQWSCFAVHGGLQYWVSAKESERGASSVRLFGEGASSGERAL